MAEVIQSLSICCPAKQCINHCETCTARQHDNPYENKYCSKNKCDSLAYWADVIKRMKYAQLKGCTTVMLTGSNEPQQDRRWLEGLYLAMQSLDQPFLNIEIQTTGAMLDYDYLKFLKGIGVTTIAISTFSIFNDNLNMAIENCADKTLSIERLCNTAYEIGLNIRICINVTDHAFSEVLYEENNLSRAKRAYEVVSERESYGKDISFETVKTINSDVNVIYDELLRIFNRCSKLHANQVTFRKMWSNHGTPEADWIERNCTYCNILFSVIDYAVKRNGSLICKLPYGAARYDVEGFSVVTDTDSMAKDENNVNLKYYIIRENGKMYSSWDSPASLVF